MLFVLSFTKRGTFLGTFNLRDRADGFLSKRLAHDAIIKRRPRLGEILQNNDNHYQLTQHPFGLRKQYSCLENIPL